MALLVARAKQRMLNEHTYSIIYTVSIWTDPDAAASAISLDTYENSLDKISKANAWSKKEHNRLMAEGDVEMAKLFLPNEGRNCNPADFAFRNLAEITHASFKPLWEEATKGQCWDQLESALTKVAEIGRVEFEELSLHPQAVLGINSRRDWFDSHWSIIRSP